MNHPTVSTPNHAAIGTVNRSENPHSEESPFVLRSYTKAELSQLYSPGREPASALQNLYRWIRKCDALSVELRQAGYDKHRHSFLKREVEIILKHLGDP